MNNNKTFNDFLVYRWNSFYKPIAVVILFVALLAVVITGFVMGASQLWDLVMSLDKEILKTVLPVASLSIIVVLVEYTAYKDFMKSSFIPEFKDLADENSDK